MYREPSTSDSSIHEFLAIQTQVYKMKNAYVDNNKRPKFQVESFGEEMLFILDIIQGNNIL